MKKEDFVALGIAEDVAEKAAAAWTETLKGFIPKHRFDEVNDAKKTAEDSLKDRDKQLDELKKTAGLSDDLKKQIETLQADNKTAKEGHEAEMTKLKIERSVDMTLASAGVTNPKQLKAVKALLDLTDAKLDGDAVKGLDVQIKTLQEAEDSKFLFNTGGTTFKGAGPGEGSGGSGGAGGTKNPWAKEHFNLTEQGKLLRDNPELAAQLKNSAKG